MKFIKTVLLLTFIQPSGPTHGVIRDYNPVGFLIQASLLGLGTEGNQTGNLIYLVGEFVREANW